MKADLYLDRIELQRYLTPLDCKRWGCASAEEILHKWKSGVLRPIDCSPLEPNRAYALEVLLALDQILPEIEITQHPVPGLRGYQGFNHPGPEDPVLVTGDALATQEVIMAVLSTTTAPFHLLFLDCRGHTIDMAMIYETFTSEKLMEGLQEATLGSRVSHRELLLPGAAARLRKTMEACTGWKIRIGPLCAGELPLFFGESWRRP